MTLRTFNHPFHAYILCKYTFFMKNLNTFNLRFDGYFRFLKS